MIYKYIRFSTDSQDQRQQEHTIDLWLSARGMTADETIKDEGISGGVSYRGRKLFGLVKSISLGDTIIVSEISRITRSGFGELNELIQSYFKPNRMRLVICNVGLDINCSSIDAMTELQLSMLAIFAKMEKELIVGRTKSALDARKELLRKDGGWTSKKGNWTTGFGRKSGVKSAAQSDVQKRAAKARLGSDPTRRRQWLLMKDLYGRGDSIANIASTLNATGETTPKGTPWTKGAVYNAIKNWGVYFID